MNSQDKNYVIGVLSSIIINTIVIVLFILMVFTKQQQKPHEKKITLNMNELVQEVPESSQESQKPKNISAPPKKAKKQEKFVKQKEIKETPKDQNRTVRSKEATGSSILSALNDKFKAMPRVAKGNAGGLINSMYGSEFDKMSNDEQDFLEKHFKEIVALGQKQYEKQIYMNRVSDRGEGVLEFYLLPNGDIEDLKVKKGSGYSRLDRTALEATQLACKDFPRPKVKTKIKIPYILY